jgi:hypothetical protein
MAGIWPVRTGLPAAMAMSAWLRRGISVGGRELGAPAVRGLWVKEIAVEKKEAREGTLSL